jgi:FK506-binding nuclear protein
VLQNYQQTLDFVVGEDERIFFLVTGTHTVHLTGNYVIPTDDGQAQLYDDEEEEEDDYDLSPDEDELEALEEEDVSGDELDDLADPRVTEVDTDEGEQEPPKLVASATGKGKNKRPAPASDDEEDDEEANLDDIMAKSLKAEEPATAAKEEPKKMTKAEKKKLKKLKKNDGEAAPPTTANTESKTAEPKKEAATTNGEKKVQFAKNLEQGPTPSATPPTKSDKKPEAKSTDGKAPLGVKEVQGVIIDDRKLGTGPAAKKGNRVEMRYIGKLENGKIFDGKQRPEKAILSTNPTVNLSANGVGADKSSHKKRTKKGNRSGSKSEPAK